MTEEDSPKGKRVVVAVPPEVRAVAPEYFEVVPDGMVGTVVSDPVTYQDEPGPSVDVDFGEAGIFDVLLAYLDFPFTRSDANPEPPSNYASPSDPSPQDAPKSSPKAEDPICGSTQNGSRCRKPTGHPGKHLTGQGLTWW